MRNQPALRVAARVLDLASLPKRCSFVFALLVMGFGGVLPAQPAPLTAKPSLPTTTVPPPIQTGGGPVAIPLADGNFELQSVGPGTFIRNPTWGAWSFDVFTGIAHETSALANGNPPTAFGARVAYVSGQGTISVPCNLQVGSWRLRYRLAARNQGGVLSPQTVRVLVGGVVVGHETSLTSGYVEYTTRPFRANTAGVQTVQFVGTGATADLALMDRVLLEPLREWSNSASWTPVGVPQAGGLVTIPTGSAISLAGVGAAGAVMVMGELVVPNATTSLTASSVMVTGNSGRLEVGRREAPMVATGSFTLTLVGAPTPTNSKFLMAQAQGTVDLHGTPKTSWTRLTMTATPGATAIQVADSTGWQQGDEIVIAGSEGQALPGIISTNFQSYAERFSIGAINGNVIQLAPPGQPSQVGMLARLHISSTANYPAGGPTQWTVEQHAEVGMLSHNVRVTSVPVQIPGLSPTAMFGGHIMIQGDINNQVGRGRFSSVELHLMGQTKQLGRYPIHWHMCRDNAAGQYIVDSSIHESFNRAVTVHGTDNILVDGNVAYRNLGHAYFLEDGSEQDNVITNNLAIETLKPVPGDEVIPSDNEFDQFQNRTPAAFWITNPQNTFVGNVASDTIGTGFWFALPREVLGLSNPNTPNAIPHNATSVPQQMDLTEFRGNVAHGCRQGLDLHDGIFFATEAIQTNLTWLPPSGEARLVDFLAYACDTGIYSGDGDNDEIIVHDRPILVDNVIHVRLASSDRIENPLFVADTGNGLFTNSPVNGPGVGKEHEAYRIYDGAPTVVGAHFDGFHIPNFSRLLGSNGAALRRTNHTFDGATFNPQITVAAPRCEFDDFSSAPGGGTGAVSNAQSPADPRSWGFSVWDESGSITGGVGSIMGNHPWMQDGTHVPYINGPSDPSRAFFTPKRFGHLYVREPNVPPTNLPEITFTRTKAGVPTAQFIHDYKVDGQKQVPVIVSNDFLYTLDWTNVGMLPNNGLPTSNPNQAELKLRLGSVFPDDAVLVLLKLGQPSVTVSLNGTPIASTTNPAELRQIPPGGASLMYVNSAGNLYLRVMNLPTEAFLDINW